jgi:enamine deaminase RidA (YjgF/YER057c/UK114 family)
LFIDVKSTVMPLGWRLIFSSMPQALEGGKIGEAPQLMWACAFEALNPQKGNIMSIIRHEIRQISDENRDQPIISQAVVHGNVAYFAGITPNPIVGDIKTQTAQVLRRVDELLNLAGTDKSQLLSAQVWIADMRLFEDHNSVWNEWVDPANPPARACLTTDFWRPGMLVEVMVVAALP